MKITFMITMILYFKVIADSVVDVIMFYNFRNSEITRFG